MSADPPPFPPVLLPDAEATSAFGAWLAPRLAPGDTLLLNGPIGSGKTHLARALIQALLAAEGRHEDVPSPTFTLVQVYDTAVAEIWHADLYRLSHPQEVIELGLDEAFATAICLIEWPDRLGGLTPPGALHLDFTPHPGATGEGRALQLSGPTDRLQALFAAPFPPSPAAEDVAEGAAPPDAAPSLPPTPRNTP